MFGESGHRRVANDSYFTIDAEWIIPALLSQIKLRGPVVEPCAGRGHLVDALKAAGFAVSATDLIDYGRPDIGPGVDLFSLSVDNLAGAGAIVANLPFDVLDDATRHILDIARPHGLQVASLVRAEWPFARARRELVHHNRFLDCIVNLTKRPRWAADSTGSPRHSFSWVVWDFRRDTSLNPSVRFAP
jgi:hypothetical protein